MEHKRFFMELSYQGAAYHGWQRQPNAPSVQEVLEGALSNLLGHPIAIVGAGRTDTGVHARQMFAHYDSPDVLADSAQLVYLLNAHLPQDIAVKSIREVVSHAHARFDAVARSYEYHICREKDPFGSAFQYYLKNSPDIDLMNRAAKILFEYDDFQCFSKSNTDVKTFVCDLYRAEWKREGMRDVFYISANRFLRNMVRAIVGTLLEIGLKKRTLADLDRIIQSKDRSQAGFSVPAQGLYLTQILYPNDIFKTI
ncbi:MAG: tRNA pseudouridine(38-40) synthase TruA [Flavobacteriia bacterium]|jgi:tRNA pseudouridine38-40 synthase|nr:tRNA pseudouridine(38-40) synthase TruA [Flavobacteriia bacterium]